jgi:hypothetical protein
MGNVVGQLQFKPNKNTIKFKWTLCSHWKIIWLLTSLFIVIFSGGIMHLCFVALSLWWTYSWIDWVTSSWSKLIFMWYHLHFYFCAIFLCKHVLQDFQYISNYLFKLIGQETSRTLPFPPYICDGHIYYYLRPLCSWST